MLVVSPETCEIQLGFCSSVITSQAARSRSITVRADLSQTPALGIDAQTPASQMAARVLLLSVHQMLTGILFLSSIYLTSHNSLLPPEREDKRK